MATFDAAQALAELLGGVLLQKPLDVKGLADFLGVGEDWVYTHVQAGAIPFTRLPGDKMIRFTADHVRQILAAGDQPAAEIASPLARRRGAA